MSDCIFKFTWLLVEVASEDLVREIQTNSQKIKMLPLGTLIVTTLTDSGSDYDLISRFFAPAVGINEDPVTGSAHCCLAPFWRNRLNKDGFLAAQASNRGGIVKVRYIGVARVFWGGQAITIMHGELITS
jgi:predicted PhzF superfamily epimerase YddE/YHI9